MGSYNAGIDSVKEMIIQQSDKNIIIAFKMCMQQQAVDTTVAINGQIFPISKRLAIIVIENWTKNVQVYLFTPSLSV